MKNKTKKIAKKRPVVNVPVKPDIPRNAEGFPIWDPGEHSRNGN